LQEELRKSEAKPDAAVVKAIREYVQEEGRQAISEEQIRGMADQVLNKTKARERLQAYIAREVAALHPVFSFRDADVGAEVEADDPQGLVSPARQTVRLSLFHVLRFYEWQPKEQGQRKATELHVILQDIVEKPLEVGWTFHYEDSWEEFRRRYLKKPTALQGLKVSRLRQGSVIPTAPQMINAVEQKFVPCLILEEKDLRPWQWATLIRDGVYPTDLKVTCQGAVEKQLRLLSGLDGYRVMGRYGWSIQRQTGEWWVV
jgi:hypothetical protein